MVFLEYFDSKFIPHCFLGEGDEEEERKENEKLIPCPFIIFRIIGVTDDI